MRGDGLIACEICGQDILVVSAMWHECACADKQGVTTPLCQECDKENPTGDCPND